jgi:ribonuclease J
MGFKEEDASLLGVVLSHSHLDHYGLAHRLPESTPFLMGAAAERIIRAVADFTPSGGTFKHVIHLENGKPIELGPFVITPFLVDHSAFDAYAVLVEADGKRLFYTGDLRGHGRKSGLFERLVAHPPADVDVLLMEGSTIHRQGTEAGFKSEDDLELELTEIFAKTPGMPLVWCSGQNIDRLVTVLKAARRSDRSLIIDMYTAHILRATGKDNLPQAHWPGVRVFLPWFQKQRIIRKKQFELAEQYRPYRIFPEELAAAKETSVMLFRDSMRQDVENAHCLEGSRLVYSMWDGYLREERMKPFLEWLNQHGIPMCQCHTSGHASVKDLRRLRKAFDSAVVVPVHCAEPEVYATTFDRVQLHSDNEWWDVDGGAPIK